MLFHLLLVSFLFVLVPTDQVVGVDIVRETYLDPAEKYHLKWEVDFAAERVTFTATVTSTGFIGLGISPSPNMGGADIVIGGITQGGEIYFSDYHATRNGEPSLDSSQDWTLISGTEQNGVTTLKFSRPLVTCDTENDVAITTDTQYLIWAMGEDDTIRYHTSDPARRGPMTINLLDPAPALVDLSVFEVINVTREAYPMPSHHTTYWCTIHKLPNTFDGSKTHIVAFDIILDSEWSKAHTHHAVIHRCIPPEGIPSEEFFEQHVGADGDDCYAESPTIPTSNCQPFIYVWSVGGGPLVLPEDVGYFMGTTGANEYVMLEVHYDNPQEEGGRIFNTGISIYHTDEIRPINAALMLLGHHVSYQQTIPPRMEEFVTAAHCGSDCTASTLPPDGVNIFNVLLHSHLTGRKMRLRHFRDREELPWIATDNHYDFNYQASRPLRENVKFLPGDQLTVECTYGTMDRTTVTLGGHPSTDEMCQAFIWLYPYENYIACQSYTEPMDQVMQLFGIEEMETSGDIMDKDPLISRPAEMAGRTYTSVLNADPWTDEKKEAVQTLTRFGIHKQQCHAFVNTRSIANEDGRRNVSYPVIDEEYQPDPVPCISPERKNNLNQSPKTVSGINLLLSGVVVALMVAVL